MGESGVTWRRAGLVSGLALAVGLSSLTFAQTADDLGLSMGLPDEQAEPPVAPVPAGFVVNSIAVSGNQFVDAGTVAALVNLPKGTRITEGQLNDAWQRVFASGLFRSVQLVPQGGTLQVIVVENPTIRTVDFQGNKIVKDEELQEVVGSKNRRIFSVAEAEADVAALTDLYEARGRTAARITPKVIRRDGNQLDLVFEIAEGDVNEIAEITIIGNRDFSDYRLRQVLNTKQAGILHRLIQRDSYNPDRLELDKQLLGDFYLSRGYLDFKILDASASYSRERDRTFLSFTIEEGQAFKLGKVTTTSEIEGLDAAEFDRLRKPRPGVAYAPNLIQNTVEAMETLALQKGLNFVTVDPRLTRNDANGTVDVNFVLIKGPRVFVERIDIEGNTTTLDQVIRRQFRTVEGDPMNRREIAQASERIRALGFFSDVQVSQTPGSTADAAVVKVAVTEEPTGSLTLGAAYGASSGFGLNIGFSERNFLGRGQGLTVNIQSGSDNVDSRIEFSDPSILGRDLAFAFTGTYGTTEHPRNAWYDTEIASVSPSLTFPIAANTRLRLNYRIANERIFNLDEAVADDVTTPAVDETATGTSAILQREAGDAITSSLGYQVTRDTRGTGLDGSGGFLISFGQDFAGLGGDVNAITTSARVLTERKFFNEDVTVQFSLEGGAVTALGDEATRVTDRFSGAGKIRGFEPRGIGPRDLTTDNQDGLGGNFFAVASAEAQFPLGLPEEYGIGGAAFVDLGSVWGLDDTAGTGGPVDDAMYLRSVVGLSLLWNTPIGPLRFDFTKALKKEDYDLERNFDFNVSAKF